LQVFDSRGASRCIAAAKNVLLLTSDVAFVLQTALTACCQHL